MLRVLVLDDEAAYGARLQRSLARAGHEVETAADGRAAIDLAQRFNPDVLIADWNLGSTLDGLETAEFMRAINPRLETILISGYPSETLRDQAAQSSVAAFLQKPFTSEELCAAVQNIQQQARRISRCAECGLALPLLRPLPGESATSWICAYCGSRYAAVLDTTCSADIIANVRPTQCATNKSPCR
ncbi:MAG: response regulator [Phycisphaerae bacterium]|jgi:DNA-binding response OmpR family regulator